MAQDVTIAGAAYAAVPGVALPLTAGGGSALFVDTADATASAADIASGMTAYVNGEKVTGTGSVATVGTKAASVTDKSTTISFTGLSGAPTAFAAYTTTAQSNPGILGFRSINGSDVSGYWYYSSSRLNSFSGTAVYSDGTLTITLHGSLSARFMGTYALLYVY